MTPLKIEWKAYDRIQQTHSPHWYWAVGIIALSITVTAIILHNTLFAILVVISTIVLFLRTMQKPRLISYEITNRGVWFDKDFSPFTAFEAFWIDEEEREPKLILKAKGLIMPLSIISLQEIDSQTVREFLQQYVVESELHEPLSKRVMEYLGF